jgi:hypothetical protein
MTEPRRRWSAKITEVAKKKLLCVLCGLCALSSWSCGGGIFRPYEYEEDVYLSLDGSATIYVNSSLAALNALRGTSFDVAPNAPFDRGGVRDYFASANTHVAWVRYSRRNNRRFAHVRLEVDDIRRLAASPAFSWSTIDYARDGDLFVYKQTVGAPAGKDVPSVNWSGREIVAFRLHLPSKVVYQNTQDKRRGNIFVWEQPLADRLRGVPIAIEARMETQSILYRTLWLFGATFVAVAIAFALVIAWVLKKAPAEAARVE